MAQSGAHVVMAVRNTKAAQELIQKWQVDSEGLSIPLNVEVTCMAMTRYCVRNIKLALLELAMINHI